MTKKTDLPTTVRPLRDIAREIRREWPRPYFGAVPYLDAMGSLDACSDRFYEDSGQSIVLYFLANASAWRGDAARRIKAELKAHTKGVPVFAGIDSISSRML